MPLNKETKANQNKRDLLLAYLKQGNPDGVVANMLYSNIIVSEFKCYYIPFQTNILGKGMSPFISLGYESNSTSTGFGMK